MRSVIGVLALAVSCGRVETRPASTADASPDADSALPVGASVDASVDSAPAVETRVEPNPQPFGAPRTASETACRPLRKHVAEVDLRTSFVSGEDLQVLVNRSPTGQLAADWAPSDLVDLRSGQPSSKVQCERKLCLRREAAAALAELLEEMKKRGFPGKVESAFRGYTNQCGTFLHWAAKGSFCAATEQSALPGHSQHQLGTTIDIFTEEWAKDARGVFRDGFGCTPAGIFLRENGVDAGFVMPYPIHPDDRHSARECTVRNDIPVTINPKTGYRFEHWHLRYIGKDAAARFAKAFSASGPGTPNEITLEQWLRAEKGIAGGDAELPECDGCNCGACSTLAPLGEHACDKRSGALHLDEHGRPLRAAASPAIVSATVAPQSRSGSFVEVHLSTPDGVATQPPIVSPDGAGYTSGATYEKLSPYPKTAPRAYPPLAGAWTVALEPVPNETGVAWPWRAGLSSASVGRTYNRANVLLPATPGPSTLRIPIPTAVSKVRLVLMAGGIPQGEPRTLALP